MDDFFIQEEVVIKTEPTQNDHQHLLSKDSNDLTDLDNAYTDNVEQFLLEGAYNRDLMVYLENNPENIKKEEQRPVSDPRAFPSYDSYGTNDFNEGADQFRKQSNKSPKSSKAKARNSKVKKKEREMTEMVKDESGSRNNFTFDCSLCMYTTPTEEDLKSHMLVHIGGPDNDTFIEESLVDGTYKCFFCSFYSRTKLSFADHLKHAHGNNGGTPKPGPKGADIYSDSDSDEDDKSGVLGSLHFCSHCEFSTKSYEQLQSHMAIHKEKDNKSGKNYITSKKTRSKLETPQPKIDLDRFKPTYDKDGQRAYLCSYCDYRALHRFRIVRHERIHTGEKPFSCQYCSFKCNQEGTLKIHIRRHTGEKPYHCSTCSFKTISRSSLNTHEKIHGGKSDVICSDCGLGFATSRALTKHRKLHYKNGSDDQNSPMPKRKRARTTEAKKTQTKSPPKSNISSTSHSQSYPGPTQSYKCSLCNFRCSKFLELSEHTQMHRMGVERDPEGQLQRQKYQCSVCGFKCAKKKELRAHIKVVHGIYKKQEAKGVTIKIGGYVLNITDDRSD